MIIPKKEKKLSNNSAIIFFKNRTTWVGSQISTIFSKEGGLKSLKIKGTDKLIMSIIF